MCGKAAENIPHVLSGCGALAQSKYKARLNRKYAILVLALNTKARVQE